MTLTYFRLSCLLLQVEFFATEELLRTASKRFLSHMQTTLYRLTQQSEGGHGKPNEQVAELQAFATAALGTALRIMSSRR